MRHSLRQHRATWTSRLRAAAHAGAADFLPADDAHLGAGQRGRRHAGEPERAEADDKHA